MKEEKEKNEENKKELLILAYNTWWKLRAIKNMANMKAKMMREVLFDNKRDKTEYVNIVLALLNGIDADLILEMSKKYHMQYLKTGSSPFDIMVEYGNVSHQKDTEVPREEKDVDNGPKRDVEKLEKAIVFNEVLEITGVPIEVYQHDPMAATSIKSIVQTVFNLRETDWRLLRLERQQRMERAKLGLSLFDDFGMEGHRLKILELVYKANIAMNDIRNRAVWHLSFLPFDIIEKEDKRFGDIATSLLQGEKVNDIEEQCSVGCMEDYVAGRER